MRANLGRKAPRLSPGVMLTRCQPLQAPPRVLSWGVVLSLIASAGFFWIWYERYARVPFNELGRYYDAQTQTVYTDSGFVWCLPAGAFLLLALVQLVFRLRRRRAVIAARRITSRL
jgi:hypothetical protein